MRRVVVAAGLPLAIALFVGVSGCTPRNRTSSGPSGPATEAHSNDGHEQLHDGANQTKMDAMKAELAKLSPDEAASAERQHVCPVSGEMLGTMGPPLKVDVNGRTVWICCDGCKNKLLANPSEYLAKLTPE